MVPRVGAGIFALAALLWAIAGGIVLYRVAVNEPPPTESEGRVVRMLDLTVTGMQDRNTTNRRQRFQCLPEGR